MAFTWTRHDGRITSRCNHCDWESLTYTENDVLTLQRAHTPMSCLLTQAAQHTTNRKATP